MPPLMYSVPKENEDLIWGRYPHRKKLCSKIKAPNLEPFFTLQSQGQTLV